MFFVQIGVSLPNAVEIIHRNASEKSFFGRLRPETKEQRASRIWPEAMTNGSSVGHAMAEWPPSEMVSLIAFGEDSGDASGALEMCILVEESWIGVRSAVRAVVLGSATQSVYPLVLIFMVGFF